MYKRNFLSVVGALAVLVVAGGVASKPALAAAPVITADGSSTVFPITEAVAEEFQKVNPARVTVGVSGTGGGFRKFCRGEIDIINASRPIRQSEMDACRTVRAEGNPRVGPQGVQYIELPVAFDALTVVTHRDNRWADHLTVAELKRMWEPAAQGVVTNWSQIRPGFPNVPLRLAGPGSDSGTFDYFTEAIVGTAKSQRVDYQATEDDNVTVRFVAGDRGAIGYLGMAFYLENRDRLRAVPIKLDEASPAVAPSLETVNRGTYRPLSRPLFIYVNAMSVRNRPEVRAFVEYYLTHAAKLSRQVGFVDLPAGAYTLAHENLRANRLGTAFGGVTEVGVTVEEMLRRRATQ